MGYAICSGTTMSGRGKSHQACLAQGLFGKGARIQTPGLQVRLGAFSCSGPLESKGLEQVKTDEKAWTALLDFKKAVEAAASILDFELPLRPGKASGSPGLMRLVLHQSFWSGLEVAGAEEELRDAAAASLRSLTEDGQGRSTGQILRDPRARRRPDRQVVERREHPRHRKSNHGKGGQVFSRACQRS